MLPDLENLDFAVDNPFQHPTDSIDGSKVRAAILELAKTRRPPPARSLDPVERAVASRYQDLGLDSDGDDDTGVLDNGDRIRALAAFLAVQGRAETRLLDSSGDLWEIARRAINSTTVWDLDIRDDEKAAFSNRWHLPDDTDLEKHADQGVAKYDARVDNAKDAFLALLAALGAGEDQGPRAVRERFGELDPDHQRSLLEAYPGIIDIAQGCRAIPIKMPDGRDAVQVSASYESDRPVSDFIYPANPKNWPKLGAFFKSMNPSGPEQPIDDRGHAGFSGRFRETVDLGDPDIETELEISFYFNHPDRGRLEGASAREQSEGNPGCDFVGMDFELPDGGGGGDGNIDVDHGFLHVSRKQDGRTWVRSTKTVRFRGGHPNAVSAWACLLGWEDSMKRMNSWWES
jgi:hypothetical protein